MFDSSTHHQTRNGKEENMNTKTITPIHVCDLIAHETVSLLSVLDEDAVPPAQWMRDGLALYAAAHQLEEETARHLNWIDDEIQRIRQTAAGQELILLIGDEQLVRTAGLPMQIEAVRELLHTTAQLESVESRTALLELVRTVTDLCGMEDALTANGDEAVHRMERYGSSSGERCRRNTRSAAKLCWRRRTSRWMSCADAWTRRQRWRTASSF